MALLNNIYVLVETEDITYNVETSSHPIEKGEEVTDHVQKKANELSIQGKIATTEEMSASDILAKLKNLQNKGSLIKYAGVNTLSNMQIQSFNTSNSYANSGGYDFNMTLKKVKIAKPSYTKTKTAKNKKSTGTQQVEKSKNKKVYHKVKKGDTIWKLVTKQYKSLEPKYKKTMDKCNWVMKQNPKAFSRKNDFTTLQIGKKIYIGYRK